MPSALRCRGPQTGFWEIARNESPILNGSSATLTLSGIMVSIPHAHATCDSAVTCPYIGQEDLTAVAV